MKAFLFIISASIALAATPIAADPQADPTPFWDTHSHFSIMTIEPKVSMSANYTWSVPHNSEKMARSGNGGACYPANPKTTAACTEITTQGSRWLTWPSTGDCCLCCSYAQGCGPMKQDWVSANGKYVGQVSYNGVTADKWSVQGNSPNYWLQDATTGVPVALLQNTGTPNAEVDNYDASTLNTGAVNGNEFAVPPACKASNLCPGMCAFLRNLTKTE